jgi:hypothetical protein
MKKIIFYFLLFSGVIASAQAPQLINYQGVARNSAGNIVTNAIGIKFDIRQGTPTGTVAYSETHTSTPSSVGVFTAAIGGGTPSGPLFSSISWANGPFYLQVSIDPAGGTSYSSVGTSQLMSVPYALYAANSGGGSLPTGTLTGQTIYWDNLASAWKVDKNLTNDGNKVTIGDPFITNNKLKVVSYSASDSAVIFAYKPNSSANQAAIRGIATGNATNSGSLALNPITGGHFLGYNLNNAGSAVGAVGQGISPGGDAVGLIGIASSSAASVGRSVGVYGSATGPNYATAFAAIFDRGKVFIQDTIISGANGPVGSVLTKGAGGKTYWGSAGANPWVQGVGTVTLANTTDNVYIGTNSGSAKLNIQTPIGFPSNDLSIASFSSVDAMQVFKFQGAGAGLRLINSSTTNTSVATIVSSGGGNPIGLDINISSSNPALLATSTGTAAAIQGINNSGGPSIRGYKTGSAGSAGVFELTASTSTVSALIGQTVGSGAAVHGIASGSLAALSLLLDNGHVRAVGPLVSVTSTSVAGGFSAILGAACPGCNDVRGTVSFTTGVTGFASANFADVTLTFAKPYAIIPVIILTSLTDMQDLAYGVTNVTTTGFTVRVYRSSNKSVPLAIPTSGFKFNYLVIE